MFMTAQSAVPRRTIMTTFTINEQNEIVAFATPEEAAANCATPFDSFSNADELVQLATGWPAERLLAVWNNVPGLTPAAEIKDAAKAAKLIFKRLEKNGSKPAREKKPKAEGKAKDGAAAVKGARAKGKATSKATAAKKSAPAAKAATKGKKGGKAPAGKPAEAGAPREGSKMSQAITLMQRKGGVTISELMATMGWQKHTCRGFVAGALKKAGYAVESFKPEGGERSYRLPK
jgi:hypothetical protein